MNGHIPEEKLARLRSGELRIVGVQRKRKLRKRGVSVWWDADLRALVWERSP